MQMRLCLLTACCGVPVSNRFWELGITSLDLYHQGKNALGFTFSNSWRNVTSSHRPQPILIHAWWEDKPEFCLAQPGGLPVWPRVTAQTICREFFHAGLVRGRVAIRGGCNCVHPLTMQPLSWGAGQGLSSTHGVVEAAPPVAAWCPGWSWAEGSREAPWRSWGRAQDGQVGACL